MDQVLEVISFYLTEWQQIAIDNTLYSTALAVLSFLIGSLIGGIIIAFLKQLKIGRLRREVRQRKKQLKVAEQTNDELLSQQKNDGIQIADLQQQLGQATKNLLHERNAHQSLVSEKDALFLNVAKKKQEEVVAVNTMLEDKVILVNQLQSNLTEQESKLARYEEAQVKIIEMEKEINQSAIELKTVKQQLETELNTKNKQIEEATKAQKDRVSELELKLKKIDDKSEAEKKQQVLKLESEKNTIQEKQEQETEIFDPLDNLVKTDRQQDFQTSTSSEEPKQYDHKKALEWDVAITSENNQVQENITEHFEEKVVFASEKNPAKESHAEPLKQYVASVKEQDTEKQGVVGQAIGWFSSIDKVFEKKNVVEKKVEPVQKSEIESKPINNGSDVKLKKVSVTDAGQIDRIQQANNQQREKNQSLEENQQVELKVDGPLINLEKNLQQEGFQPVISSEKKQEQETLLADKKIPTQENQLCLML
ncbi:MAG: hypothetical protein L3J59_14275 [Methylococcaceae bacterium]|nr:hypothetical protein [Methylococcaceae bacterium]